MISNHNSIYGFEDEELVIEQTVEQIVNPLETTRENTIEEQSSVNNKDKSVTILFTFGDIKYGIRTSFDENKWITEVFTQTVTCAGIKPLQIEHSLGSIHSNSCFVKSEEVQNFITEIFVKSYGNDGSRLLNQFIEIAKSKEYNSKLATLDPSYIITEELKDEMGIIIPNNEKDIQEKQSSTEDLKKQIKGKEAEEERDKIAQVIKSMDFKSPEQMAEFVQDFKNGALNLKFDGDAILIWTSITKIRKTVGLLNEDKMICEFYIKDKVLYVPMEKTKTPHYFLDQYARTFNVWLNIKSAMWQNMMNALFQQKMETTEAVEESEHVFVARETWSQICKFRVSDDPSGFKAHKGILKYGGKYYVSSKAITKLTEKTKIRVSDLSGAMTQLGMKYPGTTKKLELRCWQLTESALRNEGIKE